MADDGWDYEEVEADLLRHLQDSEQHGGYDPFGEGGCSCKMCDFVRRAIKEAFEYADLCRMNGVKPPNEMQKERG